MGSPLLSGRALRLHATVVVVVGGCLALGWWQLSRALSGNELSWVYTVEWPFFAAYAVYMWWRLLHEQPHAPRREDASPADDDVSLEERVERCLPDPFDESDPELAAYNRYLASLAAADAERAAGRTRR